MKSLIIIGAGGMGRTLFDMVQESIGYGTEFLVKGFIDDNIDTLADFVNYPPVIGKISSYIPLKEDVFICSIGGESRKQCISTILDRNGDFLTLIHQSARIGTNVMLGKGNIIGAFTTVAADVQIGNYNFIQSYTIIGHDVKIGDWNRIDSHVMCIGGIRIGNQNMIHTSAVLNHNIEVGDNAHIGACSFVTRNVESNSTVFGNPARRLM